MYSTPCAELMQIVHQLGRPLCVHPMDTLGDIGHTAIKKPTNTLLMHDIFVPELKNATLDALHRPSVSCEARWETNKCQQVQTDWQSGRDDLVRTLDWALQMMTQQALVAAHPECEHGSTQSGDVTGKPCWKEPPFARAPPGLELPQPGPEIQSLRDAPPGLQAQLDDQNDVGNSPTQSVTSHGEGTEVTLGAKPSTRDTQAKGNKKTLLVAYYPRCAETDDLDKIFEVFGTVAMVNLCRDKLGNSLCYGFIRFEEAFAAEQAFDACQKGTIILHDLEGKPWHLKASWAKTGYCKKGGDRKSVV